MLALLNKLMGGSSDSKNLSVGQTKELLSSFQQNKTAHILLDVRGPDEFRSGYIDGALNIPVSDLTSRLKEIETHKLNPVVVYCRSGGRSSMAAQILAANGFANVSNVTGGMIDWTNAGFLVKTR